MITRVVHVHDRIERAVYIGRRMPRHPASPLANPYRVGVHGTRDECLQAYKVHIMAELIAENHEVAEALIACRGKPVACWCRHDGETFDGTNGCHGDILIAILAHNSDEAIYTGRARLGKR